MRPSFVEVDLNNLRHNLSLIRGHTDNKPVMAVVKANAYGHGLVEIAHSLTDEAVHGFCVALTEEAKELIGSKIKNPIAYKIIVVMVGTGTTSKIRP